MIPNHKLIWSTTHEDFKFQTFFNNPFRLLGLTGLCKQPLPKFGAFQAFSNNPFRGALLNLIDVRRGPGRVSLMKFSSTNPVGGKNQTFSSPNPFGGKKVTTSGLHSATPSEGTSAFNQPFRLKLVSPRRGPAKIEKWSC